MQHLGLIMVHQCSVKGLQRNPGLRAMQQAANPEDSSFSVKHWHLRSMSPDESKVRRPSEDSPPKSCVSAHVQVKWQLSHGYPCTGASEAAAYETILSHSYSKRLSSRLSHTSRSESVSLSWAGCIDYGLTVCRRNHVEQPQLL